MLRLDKFLCEAGAGTRKEVKELIKRGCVRVNGEVVKETGRKLEEERAVVEVNGKTVNFSRYSYIVMNKPKGVVCANNDRREKTIFDILPKNLYRKGLFTMGRLDKDTTGLLIITNDGEFAHRLMSSKKHVDKLYYAEGKGTLKTEASKAFAEGMSLGEVRLKPAKLEIISEDEGGAKVYVTLSEGKFHQVKKMLHQVGLEVNYLKRIKIGGLVLDEALKEGEARLMSPEEVKSLTN